MGHFSEGLAAAKTNEKWGYIDISGQWVVFPQFDEVKYFSEGIAAVRFGTYWAFIKKDGMARFPLTFEDALATADSEYTFVFHEGLASVPKNNLWGYIDQSGNWIIEPRLTIPGLFYDGIARVQEFHNFGFINKAGEWIYSIQY